MKIYIKIEKGFNNAVGKPVFTYFYNDRIEIGKIIEYEKETGITTIEITHTGYRDFLHKNPVSGQTFEFKETEVD